jgi:hypothetical protein
MRNERKVNFPAWTAECSLHRSTRAYVANSQASAKRGALSPALGVRYCQNSRPGWAIENTLCGECADFVVRRVCNGGTCQLQWVRVSDWQTECWNADVAVAE